MTVLLATNNGHKHAELAEILFDHEVIIPRDLGIDFTFEESDDSFLDNALGKARALLHLVSGHTPMVIVADDSGLCVHALGGAPGVRSARYGSPDGGATELPSTERNALLLSQLRGRHDRGAHFVCCMVALFTEDRYAVVQETFHGEIAEGPAGTGGFGYDPVFRVPELGCTVAELPEGEKHRISHRGKAARGIAAALRGMELGGGPSAGASAG